MPSSRVRAQPTPLSRRPPRRSTTTKVEPVRAGAVASAEALREAALALFLERGFHGTSMRDIAARAGSSVSHMYYYFPSKSDVLRSMLTLIVEDLLADLRVAWEAPHERAASRLVALVRAQVLFHCRRQSEAFVSRSELRSLDAADRPKVIALYDEVGGVFKAAIEDGIRLGEFTVPYRAELANAIVTMCNAVSGWYRASGPSSPTKIADYYAELALRMLGAREGVDG